MKGTCIRWLIVLLLSVLIMDVRFSLADIGQNIQFTAQMGHQEGITTVAVSANGQLALTGSGDRTAKLWDVTTGKEIHTFFHTNRVSHVSFSRDDLYAIALAHNDIRVWDVLTKEEVGNYVDKHSAFDSVIFHPKEKNLILFDKYSSRDNLREVAVYDISKKQVVRSIKPQFKEISAIDLSPDGRLLAVAGYNTQEKVRSLLVKLIEYETGSEIRLLENQGRSIMKAAFSPDGTRFLFTTRDQENRHDTKLLDTRSWREVCSWPTGYMGSISFSPDGKYIAASTSGLKIFDIHTCKDILSSPKKLGFDKVFYMPDGRHILATSGASPQLLDAETGQEVSVFSYRKRASPIYWLALVGGRYVTHFRDNDIIIWDLQSLKPYRTYKNVSHYKSPLLIGPDNRTLIFWQKKRDKRSVANRIVSMDIYTGNMNTLIDGPPDNLHIMSMSPDGKMIAAGGGKLKQGWLNVWSIATGQVIRQFEMPNRALEFVSFSPDGRTLMSGTLSGTVQMWDMDTGQNTWRKDTVTRSAKRLFYSPDGKHVFSTGAEHATMRDAATGEPVRRFWGHKELIESAALSSDGRQLLTGDYHGNIKFWNVSNEKEVRSLKSQMSVNDLLFLPDARYALSCSGITVTLWDLTSGKSLNMVSLGDEWLVYTEDGLFDASYNGTSLVAMVKGLHGYGIEQLALKNNRPDLIMQRFGLGSPELIAHYKAKYLQRLKKAGFTEADLSSQIDLPEARITETHDPDTQGQCDIGLEFKDKKSLRSYQVYVNDVPLFGTGGKSVSGKKVTLTEKLYLVAGQNKIEVSVINSNGQESLRPMKLINYKGKPEGDLYYLGFGVSHYKNPKLNLEFAHKDALDLAKIFSNSKTFKKVHVKTFTNEQVTAIAIKEAKGFLQNARPEDTFVLFIAGHGLHDHDADTTYYFVTHETNLNNLASTAASFELIEDLLMNVVPRKKLFLMDTCESGEADQQVENRVIAQATQRGLKARTSRAIVITGKDAAKAVPREYLLQKDRFIYTDLLRRSGTIVFSSSRGGEFSYESAAEQNGFFTKELIRALTSNVADSNKDGIVSTDELRAYVSQAVAERTNYMQNPTVDRDNLHQKFGFPISLPFQP